MKNYASQLLSARKNKGNKTKKFVLGGLMIGINAARITVILFNEKRIGILPTNFQV